SVRADVGGVAPPREVSEADETNNTRSLTIQIVRPDLVVQSVTAPAVSAPGANISATTVVKNLAATPGRAPATLVRWFLSRDTTPVVTNDQILGEAPLASLGGLTTASVTKLVTIPASTRPGRYRVKAKVNADGVVQETNATNDVGVQTAPIVIG